MLRAILFDLDDTLFDHSHCARAAITAVHGAHACFRAVPFEAFERTHAGHLEALHRDVLSRARTVDEARLERFRRLLGEAGGEAAVAAGVADQYRTGYVAARRAVRGAAAALARLRRRASIVVVSNNLLAEQQAKIEECGLAPHIDALVVSEQAGAAKPDPRIFEVALDAASARASEAVMVGDSWPADIAGAHAAGIVPIWFNPLGLPAPAAPAAVSELRGFEPAAEAVDAILRAHASRADRD